MPKRNLFNELEQGLNEVRSHKKRKMTLKTHYIPEPKKITITPAAIRLMREEMHLSQSLFSRLFRISQRTLEKWEQGKTHPNEQATVLIMLIKKKPELLEELQKL